MASRPDIFATVQTPPGRGGIAVVAVSGGEAEQIIADIFEPISSAQTVPERAFRLGRLVDDGEVIDQAILARLPGGFELSLHGGPAVVRKCLALLCKRGAAVLPCDEGPVGFEPAHCKWNNPAIGLEMLRCLPSARGPLAVSLLTQQWSGGLSELARGKPTAEALRKAADRLDSVTKLLNPPEVVIAGPPNAGKSQLANVLVGRPVSIVHGSAGTTRDWVREIALLGGAAVWLTDTAGLWQTNDTVDVEAIRRARECIAEADLVVLLAEGAAPQTPRWLHAGKALKVATKCDLCRPAGKPDVTISAVTGEGIDRLGGAILALLGLSEFDPSEPAAFTARQADLLLTAAKAVADCDQTSVSQLLRQLLTGQSSECSSR
jgi:small GTP-binding protein